MRHEEVDYDTQRLIRQRKARAKRSTLLMVTGLCVLLIVPVVAGVVLTRKAKQPVDSTESPSGPSAQRATRTTPVGATIEYKGEYMGDNPIAADVLYKDKRVLWRGVEAETVGRLANGRAFVGSLAYVPLAGAPARAGTGGTVGHAAGPDPAPNFYFLVSDDVAAKVKVGNRYDVTGTCRGYTPDKLWRSVSGMNWHVDFEDCDINPAK